MLAATLLNHALAGVAGGWVNAMLGPTLMRGVLGLSFVAMAIWMLIPDQLDEDDTALVAHSFGIFGATFVAFFLAEMGDKTQIATVALAVRFDVLAAVVLGTTLSMLLANVATVLLGDVAAKRLPVRAVHTVAAAIFAGLGISVLAGFGAEALAAR